MTPGLSARLRRLGGRLATPLVPADYLDLFHPLRSGADLRGRVVAVHSETADAVTIVIRPGRDWAGHVPGQYVRLGVDVDGVRQWRAYSVTSSLRRTDGCIGVTVKAMPDGVVSGYLVRRLRPGTLVHLDQATGEFTLRPPDGTGTGTGTGTGPGTSTEDAPTPTKVLFLTAGSGITPVMGMLRNLDDLAPAPLDVVLVHSAPGAADVIFGDELRALHGAGRLRLVEQHTDEAGMLTPSDLEALVPDLGERETWACGPTGMLDELEKHWADRGLAHLLHTERFRPTVLATGEGGAVTFGDGTPSERTLEAPGDRPLLDVGEEAGYVMPSGCRMGICYGCVLPLREGAVRDLRTGDLTTSENGDHVLVQTCVSAAAGDCSIALTR